MTLMDLALETRDYEWAKRLHNLDDKILYNETLTKDDEIKCELAEANNKAKESEYKISTYTDSFKEDIIQTLKEEGKYEDYLFLAGVIKGLDDDIKRLLIRRCLAEENDDDDDVEIALEVMKILEE